MLAEWDAASGPADGLGAAKVPFFNRRILAEQIGLAEDADRHGRERCRRRLRRARRVLSRGFPDPVRGAACRPAGEMDRGPARESDGDEPRARGGVRHRDRLRARRHDPRRCAAHVYADMGAYIRTNGAGRRAQRRAVHVAGPTACRNIEIDSSLLADQQDAGRHLSRAGPLRGRFLPRAAARHGGAAISASTASRSAAAISSRAAEMPYPVATHHAVRARRTSTTAATIARRSTAALPEFGWAEKSKLQGKLIDGRYHGLGDRLLHRGRRRRPEGDRAARARRRRHDLGLSSARRRSARASRRCSRRSPPTRSKCRSSASARVHHGSTAYVSEGYGAYHSRSTVMGGSAVLDAANEFARRDPRGRRRSGSAARRPTIDDRRGQGQRPGRHSRLRSPSFAGAVGRGRVPQQAAHLQLRRARGACRGRSRAPAMSRSSTTSLVEDVGRIDQSVDAARPGDRLAGAGAGRRLARASRIRRRRAVAHRLARRLSAADRERFSEHARGRCSKIIPRRSIRSAPRAPAKAASSRPAA